VLVLLGVCATSSWAQNSEDQLQRVRSRISAVQQELDRLSRETADVRSEKQRLDLQLELARERVREVEITVARSRGDLGLMRQEIEALGRELAIRRELMERHLEMTALLGSPGPLQMIHDAFLGGDLERAVATAVVMTEGQAKMLAEYQKLQRQRSSRLVVLSRALERAQRELAELDRRRAELDRVDREVRRRLAQLERETEKTGDELADLQQREAALGRLLERLEARASFGADEDIRRYRGALPWPASGTVARGFGRRFLPKYSTYTVCNGNWLHVEPGTEVTAVFRGEVAFARHFKGYGNMVVVDHGRDVFSLVAGLSSIHVRVGQRVALGARLGLAGPTKETGNLYVEVRVGGTPTDPQRWLQLD
jgi:septal ring factor EnvC (AmiA/AmiB activator)